MIALIAALALALALTGCGGASNSSSRASSASTGAAGSGAGKLPLKNAGQLTVGAEFPVTGFVELPRSNPKGFEVDVAGQIAHQLHVPKVSWMQVVFANLFSPAPKQFDFVINEVTITPQRKTVDDFSIPYFDANQGVLVRKGTPAAHTVTLNQLRKLQLGGQASTTGLDYIKSTIKPSASPREYSSTPAAAQAVANGQIDGFVIDVPIAIKLAQQFPKQLAVSGEIITNERYGILFQKGNPLRAQVNQALRKLEADGTLKRLQDKWFPGSTNLPMIR
ncbi:MAG: ABC transporter substrate-binding protein [Actinomycetota bacterium]|nr:ABC transporter substrate-binding protein [Actinomycetota bacterium]